MFVIVSTILYKTLFKRAAPPTFGQTADFLHVHEMTQNVFWLFGDRVEVPAVALM
jgi:hypothetical protein